MPMAPCPHGSMHRYASIKSTNLKGATFDGADLTQALMEGATLTDASFVNATAGAVRPRRARHLPHRHVPDASQ